MKSCFAILNLIAATQVEGGLVSFSRLPIHHKKSFCSVFNAPTRPQSKNYKMCIVKLHSKLQTQLNFSWLEKELTLFSHGRRRKEEGRPSPSF